MHKFIKCIFLFFLSLNISTAQSDATGLLSHWTLDENDGLVANDSIGNNSGTLINSPIWSPTLGQLGGALEFDGIDDRVDLGVMDIPGSEMSISFWFKADDFDVSDARFISKATGTSGNHHYWMVGVSKKSKLSFRLKTNGITTTLTSKIASISPGQWHHVTATYDGNKMKIYCDGKLIDSTAKTGQIDINNSVPVAIGNQPNNAGSKPFDGLIDDVRIYTSALRINQIQALIDGNPEPIQYEPDLLSYWALDETNSSVASDSLGNNNGELINSPIWQPTLGQWEGALEFDGIDDRVDLGSLDIPGSEMSISFWFKADDFDVGDARFISKATGTTVNKHYWMVSASKKSKLCFRLKTNGVVTTLTSEIGTISIGQWHHVTATYDGNEMKIYRDGELVASTVNTGEIDTNNNVSVAIGNQPTKSSVGARPFDGLIDSVRIYTAALTIEQIQALIESNTSIVLPEPLPNPPQAINEPPVADAGSDQTHVVNQEGGLALVTLSSENSTDIDGTIGSVEWLNENNEQLSTSSTMVTSLPIGGHPITLKVMDNEGASDTDTVTITIDYQPVVIVDDVPPSVSLTSPGNGETTTGVITVSTDASDNVGVVAVKVFLDEVQLGQADTTPPYAISWDTLQDANGPYTLVAKAFDAAGNVGTSSSVQGVIDNVDGTDSSFITPEVTPTRTTCVAPCSIFFNASKTTSTITGRPFHKLNYSWDFDDAGAGNWAWTGKSRNKATGAVATHVFESAGVHNVTLTVRDVEDNVATKQTTITIIDPDSFYSDNNTFCFSKSSDFSGCPTSLSSQHITTSNIQVVENYVGSGKRLLLHRGDSWSTDNSIKLIGPGPSVLGAFGTCLSADARGICANAPKIKITSSSAKGISSSWTNPMIDWRVMDIELSGPSNSKDHGFAIRHDNQHILLLRMNIHDFYGLVYADNSGTYTNGNVTVANSKLIHSIGGKGANNMWYSGNNMSILGNEVNDSRETEHVIRSPYLNGGVISNNVLLNQAAYKHVLKLHAPGWSKFGLYSQKIVISDNKLKSSDLSGASWMFTIQPQRCTSFEPTDERIRNVVVERNLFESGRDTQVGLLVGSRDVTIRNNLFNMAKGVYQRAVSVGQCNIEPKPLNVAVINNSFYSAYAGNFKAIAINSTASNASVINNLAYAPNSSNPSLFSGSAFAQNNLLMDTNEYVKSSPVNPDDFKLKASSSAINSGTNDAKALLDFELNHRSNISNIPDIGAFEQ